MGTSPGFDVAAVRADFPVLAREVNGHPLNYLDSAASAQRPRQVLDAMTEYYERHHANVHRGVYTLAEEATALFEGARDKVAALLHAPDRAEVVFTKNSTEGINLVARVLGDATGTPWQVREGDNVVVTEMEHHSNLVPWQMLCQRTGAQLRWISLTPEGRLDLSELERLVDERTKVVAFAHQSNMLGTVNPTSQITARARQVGALTLLDASQSVPHSPVDVVELGVDFLVCTGHKMLGPTGIGVVWGRLELLEALPPFLGGGEMIEVVTMAGSTYAAPPHKFEAGTPMIAEAVGLGAAVDYLAALGLDAVRAHEKELTVHALEVLGSVSGLRIVGPRTAVARGGAISFTLDGVHPHDVGQVLDSLGIAVRVGQHCAAPACARLGVPATTRASFYVYTTREEITALGEGLEQVKRFFRAA